MRSEREIPADQDRNERIKLSFEFARDTTKLLITLAVSIITLTITFSNDFIGEGLSDDTKLFVLFAWGAFFFSIVCGCWTLLALTGSLTDADHGDIFSTNITIPSAIQIISFLIGLVLTVVFGALAL